MKLKNILVSILAGIVAFLVQYKWRDLLYWISVASNTIVGYEKEYVGVALGIRILLSLLFSILFYLMIRMVVMRCHFRFSNRIIRRRILKGMKDKVDLPKCRVKNQRIDSFIQSPLEYVDETLKGNEAPVFKPDAYYQEVLLGDIDTIKYIVAITSENPNLFLDPTIGFYMSNCYAASLVRHVNDYLKTFDYQSDSVPQLFVQDKSILEADINKDRLDVIEKLVEKSGTNGFEFIRFFIYDKNQKLSCDNAIFPSLKASQDLFRTFSYYIQKELLKESLENHVIDDNLESQTVKKNTQDYPKRIVLGGDKYKNKWQKYEAINKALWRLYDHNCVKLEDAKEVQKRRIKDTIPEFLFVFYEDGVEVHSYLAGHYWRKPKMVEGDADLIRELISFLATYVKEDDKNGQLEMEDSQINKKKTFITWKSLPKDSIAPGGASSDKKEKPVS